MLNETHHAPPRYKIPEFFSSLLVKQRRKFTIVVLQSYAKIAVKIIGEFGCHEVTSISTNRRDLHFTGCCP